MATLTEGLVESFNGRAVEVRMQKCSGGRVLMTLPQAEKARLVFLVDKAHKAYRVRLEKLNGRMEFVGFAPDLGFARRLVADHFERVFDTTYDLVP